MRTTYMQRLGLIVGLFAWTAQSAWAARHHDTEDADASTVTLLGYGMKSKAPDYIKFDVKVNSFCYANRQSVLEASNQGSEKIKEILERYAAADAAHNTVIARIGETRQADEYTSDGNGERHKICSKGWRSNNTLEMTITDISVWPELQSEILAVSDAYVTSGETGENPARTHITLSEPEANLWPESVEVLRAEADKAARLDAVKKFAELRDQIGLVNTSIRSMRPIGGYLSNSTRSRGGNRGGARNGFQPKYGEIAYIAKWKVTWNITDSGEGVGALRGAPPSTRPTE